MQAETAPAEKHKAQKARKARKAQPAVATQREEAETGTGCWGWIVGFGEALGAQTAKSRKRHMMEFGQELSSRCYDTAIGGGEYTWMVWNQACLWQPTEKDYHPLGTRIEATGARWITGFKCPDYRHSCDECEHEAISRANAVYVEWCRAPSPEYRRMCKEHLGGRWPHGASTPNGGSAVGQTGPRGTTNRRQRLRHLALLHGEDAEDTAGGVAAPPASVQ